MLYNEEVINLVKNEVKNSTIKSFIQATKNVFEQQSVWNKDLLIVKVNEDYPYVYTRDLSILIKFLIENDEKYFAKSAIDFLMKCQLNNGEWVQRYNDISIRQEDKLQEDNTPLALWALLSFIDEYDEYDVYNKYKIEISKGLNWIESNLNDKNNLLYSHSSNHEDGINEGFELWTNSVLARVFYLSSKIIGENKYNDLYNKVYDSILKNLTFDDRFIRKIDKKGNKYFEADIILLSPFYFDILDCNDILLKNSIKKIEKELYDNNLGGYWRYEDDVYFPGPWIIYSAIIAQYYYNVGDKNKGDEIISWIFKHDDNGELPEHLVSEKQFNKYKDHQIKRAKSMPIEKMKKARINAIKNLESTFENSNIAYYAQPILWSHIETARALKDGGYIDNINLSS